MEWQDISTAPRDVGSKIIGWCGNDAHTLDYHAAYRHPPHILHEEAWFQMSDSGRMTTFYPTHWMPIPAPPKQD